MTRNNKIISYGAVIYTGINLVLSAAQYYFKVFSDQWMQIIFALDLIIPATVLIIYLLYFSKRA